MKKSISMILSVFFVLSLGIMANALTKAPVNISCFVQVSTGVITPSGVVSSWVPVNADIWVDGALQAQPTGTSGRMTLQLPIGKHVILAKQYDIKNHPKPLPSGTGFYQQPTDPLTGTLSVPQVTTEINVTSSMPVSISLHLATLPESRKDVLQKPLQNLRQ